MNKYQEYFKKVCLETAKLSTCISKQVGCVLVRDNRILAIGYNGVPSGDKHCNEIYKDGIGRENHHEWSKDHEVHAEQNLIAYCAKNGIATGNSELYLTLEPCVDCAKLIYASGIIGLYYIQKYDKEIHGLEFLLGKIKITRI